MPFPHISSQFNMSNYYSFDGTNENLTLLGASTSFGKTSLTIGAGNDCTINPDGHIKNKPAIEIKGKYNIGEHLNMQARFREIGGKEQYRITFGGSYSFDKNNSIYSSAHITTNDFHKYKGGLWAGYTHKFNNGISLSAEFQQNLDKETSRNLGKTLGSFNDGNKLFNVMLTVPLTK